MKIYTCTCMCMETCAKSIQTCTYLFSAFLTPLHYNGKVSTCIESKVFLIQPEALVITWECIWYSSLL